MPPKQDELGFRADDVEAAYPLFQEERSGSTPTSALQLRVTDADWNCVSRLNNAWHSALPQCDKGSMSRGFRSFFAAEFDGVIYAVAIWSSPVTQGVDDGKTAELRRLAISPNAPKNTASRMLGIMSRLMKSRYPTLTRLISYQATAVHKGTIYRAAGWLPTALSKFRPWNTRKRRAPRSDKQRSEAIDGYVNTPSTRRPPQIISDKQRWEKLL